MERLTLRRNRLQSKFHCYRLNYRADYDEEMVWKLIQKYSGTIKIYDTYVDFWIDSSWNAVLELSFPDIERVPELDYD